MDLVEALTSLEQTLSLWCMSVNSGSDDDAAQFAQLVAARERISSAIQQLELNRAKWAALDLSATVRDVNRLSSSIQDTEREVNHSRSIMDKVTTTLDLAAKAAGVLSV